MRWYWILLIISIIVGPFESLYVYNKAKKRREQRKKEAGPPAKDTENGGTP